ncbi:unnamed protein product, partial [Ectocarpus fasciculatus]
PHALQRQRARARGGERGLRGAPGGAAGQRRAGGHEDPRKPAAQPGRRPLLRARRGLQHRLVLGPGLRRPVGRGLQPGGGGHGQGGHPRLFFFSVAGAPRVWVVRARTDVPGGGYGSHPRGLCQGQHGQHRRLCGRPSAPLIFRVWLIFSAPGVWWMFGATAVVWLAFGTTSW